MTAELGDRLDLRAGRVAQPDRADGADVRQLGEAPQLTGPGQARAVELVEEVGVGVEVDDVEAARRLHPEPERIADRVIAADGDHQRLALGNRAGGCRDPRVVALGVGALDQDVAAVDHRHPAQELAIGLDVVPAVGVFELLAGGGASGFRPTSLTGREPRLGGAAVVGDAEEGDVRIERVEVGAQLRHAVERLRSRVDRGRCHRRPAIISLPPR